MPPRISIVNRDGLSLKSVGRGFTLIEAMIALLVLTIGLVGVAAMHLTSLKGAHSSYYRSVASTVALDLEERIWDFASVSLTAPGNCLEASDLTGIRAELLDQWTPAPGVAGQIGIPNLAVQFGSLQSRENTRVQPGASGLWYDRWVQLPVRLTWTETRFRGDDSTTEQFDFVIRMPCVPEFIQSS